MTIQELFVAANEALLKSVSQISDEQWDIMLPEGSSSKPTTLIQAVRYHTYDDAWVPDVLTGKTKDEVGAVYDDLLQTENVMADFKAHNQRAIEAVRDFDELDKVVHLSYGDFPARDYLQHIISFRAFRSYDIAKLIGVDTTMDPAFVEALTEEFSPVIGGYRQMGVFPAALDVSAEADPQTKLLAMVGRD